MENLLSLLSVGFLILTIVVGVVKKINSGLIGIAMAMICGVLLCGIPAKTILAAWPQSLCMAIMGMTFLFAIAKNNGTLEVIAESITCLVRGKTKWLPVCFFLLPMAMALGGVAVQANVAIVAPLCMEIGRRARIPNLDVSYCVMLGACAGTLCPINPSGIIAASLGEKAFQEAGCAGTFQYSTAFLCTTAIIVVMFVAVYFIRGMYRFENCAIVHVRVKISRDQWITLAAIAFTLIAVAVFKTDTGMTAFLAGTILLLLHIDDQKRAIQGISWSTILLLGGMSLIISVVDLVGGIDLIASALSGIMGRHTAAPIMSILASCLASVASASGVVMPMLLPTISGIMEHVPGVGFYPLFAGVLVGAHTVNLSPLSVTGSLCLANCDEDQKDKLFVQQFLGGGILSVSSAVILGILSYFSLL